MAELIARLGVVHFRAVRKTANLHLRRAHRAWDRTGTRLRLVAREALRYVVDDAWLGVGSGSTANLFIDALATIKHRIKGAIASSTKTADRLKSHGIDVEELNNVADIPVYIDGADEVTARGE